MMQTISFLPRAARSLQAEVVYTNTPQRLLPRLRNLQATFAVESQVTCSPRRPG